MAKTRESSSPTTLQPRVAKNQPTQEEIALRAYQIYLERGGSPGNEFEDWMEAQRQLLGDDGSAGENGKPSENGKAPENGKPRRKPKVKTAVA
jgi:hypothetical protein